MPKIPYYDPQTGELNPHYEELTGQPNPLAQGRLPEIEFKKRNRFLFHFPESFKIKPEQISSFKFPTVVVDSKKIDHGSLEVNIRELATSNSFSTIYEYMLGANNKFDLRIELVDARNIVLDSFDYANVFFSSLEAAEFSYSDDGLMTFKVIIHV